MFNDSLPSRINVVLVMAYGSLVSLFNVVCAGLIQTETMNAVPGYRGNRDSWTGASFLIRGLQWLILYPKTHFYLIICY